MHELTPTPVSFVLTFAGETGLRSPLLYRPDTREGSVCPLTGQAAPLTVPGVSWMWWQCEMPSVLLAPNQLWELG